MKTAHLFLAAAVLASAGCNSDKGTGGTSAGGDGSLVTQEVKAPANGDWSTVVTPTTAGGFLMGDPKAKVQLVEFGSMTCPHCAEFDEQGVQPLIDKYVKSGQVGFEFRNFVRDPFDVAASLIARCNGETSFFPLTRALYGDQKNWINKLQTVSPEQQQALSALPPAQQFLEIAKLAGFQQWAAMRGVPTAKSTTCLANEAEINRLVQMNGDAANDFNVPGTPAFLINGELVEGVASWKALEPKITDALG